MGSSIGKQLTWFVLTNWLRDFQGGERWIEQTKRYKLELDHMDNLISLIEIDAFIFLIEYKKVAVDLKIEIVSVNLRWHS